MPLNLTSVGCTPRHITVKALMTKYDPTIRSILLYMCHIYSILQIVEIVLFFKVKHLLLAKA